MTVEIAIAILLALAGAAAGAWLARRRATARGRDNPDELHIGAWTINTLAGSKAANALTRARIAISGALALDRKGTLPPAGHYWSLSLYAHNTDNYFVLNDRELQDRRFDVTVYPPSAAVADNKAAVKSPSTTGIALIRMIQRKEDDLAIIQASQQSTTCRIA
jgi:hypothetical protein